MVDARESTVYRYTALSTNNLYFNDCKRERGCEAYKSAHHKQFRRQFKAPFEACVHFPELSKRTITTSEQSHRMAHAPLSKTADGFAESEQHEER